MRSAGSRHVDRFGGDSTEELRASPEGEVGNRGVQLADAPVRPGPRRGRARWQEIELAVGGNVAVRIDDHAFAIATMMKISDMPRGRLSDIPSVVDGSIFTDWHRQALGKR
jgi:hypothetical protein